MARGRQLIHWLFILLTIVIWATLPLGQAVAVGESAGAVTISYDLNRIPSIASNQFSIWIEDSQGRFVKTLFVTWFTGKGGYERRPDCLPLWRKAAGLEGPPTDEIDAVTKATPQPGKQSIVWDYTDRDGRPVPAGKYVYKIEGTLFWTKEVLWTGEINIGSAADASRAVVRYLPDAAANGNQLVTSVTATFTPSVKLSQ